MTETYAYRMEKPVDFVPQRVVSLVPSVTESLFDLNIGSRVIGVTDYCTRPAEAVSKLPRLGGTKNPNIAHIIALRPDLVIMNEEENRKPDWEQLQAAGVPVWVTHPNTVREALDLLWTIMDVFEEPSMVPRVRLIEITYEWTLGVTRELPPKRTFAPIWRDPWMTFNRNTFVHDMLRVCGGENVFADRDRRYPLAAEYGEAEPIPANDPRMENLDVRYPRISLDEVVAAQPEIVLLPDDPYPFTQADADAIAHLDIPAAKNGQIHLVDGSLLTWHGTRIAYALRDLPLLFGAPTNKGNPPNAVDGD
ncbi:MAG: ABC transporter substrate-binding protein [Anaerolineae bacterium]|nr:ABC transporter substrate-binding protein [Anaerolineae bacterium]